MARSKTTTPQVEGAMNAARALFGRSPVFAPRTGHFEKASGQIYREVEKFSTAWFERRHEAALTAIEVGARIASEGMRDPAGAMREIADWQTHSMQRLAADARDCSEMIARCASAWVEDQAEVAAESAEALKKTTRTAGSNAD